jgi:lysozyme
MPRSFRIALALTLAVIFGVPGVRPAQADGWLEGVDVSHWQGPIDWMQVAAAGKRFAIAKVTEGQTYVDPMFTTNHLAARAAGVPITGYHFAYPLPTYPLTTPDDPIVQADWFVMNANLQPGDLIPALDLETTNGLSITDLQSWVAAWLGEVSARLQVRPMIYTSPNFWKKYMGDTTMFADMGYTVLWIAHWYVANPTLPASNWSGRGWTFWQYDNRGSVPGIGGNVDLDRYNGIDLTPVTYNPDFALTTVPDPQLVKQGRSMPFVLALTRYGVPQPVTLSVTGLPDGAAATFSLTPTLGTLDTMTVTTSASGLVTPPGTYPLTITGVSGNLIHAAQATLVVTDGIAPTVVAPVTVLGGGKLGLTTTPAITSLAATDPSGVAGFAVQTRVNTGAWSTAITPPVIPAPTPTPVPTPSPSPDPLATPGPTPSFDPSATPAPTPTPAPTDPLSTAPPTDPAASPAPTPTPTIPPETASFGQPLTFGKTYRYLVKATDGASNLSGPVFGPTFRALLVQQWGTGITYSGTWYTVFNSGASGGSLRYTTRKGASATYKFSGTSVSWIAYRGPNRGAARVYVDGVDAGVIDLHAASYGARPIVFTRSWPSSGSHTIRIVCLGTSGHPRIDVDAFVKLVNG